MARRKVKNRNKRAMYVIFFIGIVLTTALLTVLPDTTINPSSYGQGKPFSQFTPEPAKNSLQLFSFPNVDDIQVPVTIYPTVMLLPPEDLIQTNISPLIIPPAGQFPPGSQVGASQQTSQQVAMIGGDISGEDTGCGIANSPLLQKGTENGKCCVRDGGVRDPGQCCSGVPYCDYSKNPPQGSGGITCGGTGGKANLYWCNAKPVIYLYPLHKTNVSVSVKVPGTIFISIPEYPAEGWKDVTAYPDGTLYYQGKKYSDLYYESSITPISPPDTGIITAKSTLYQSLRDITTRLGLNSKEREDFLEYWYPRLMELDNPYIQISVFSPEAKETIDHVDISPKPDTFIQFIMYYKGLQQPVTLKPLQLPQGIPARIGFTAVEWGGIIDNN